MNSKGILTIILFLMLGCFLNANAIIQDVEYLKGDDFVQLYFKTNGIIPIPDLFYPNEENTSFLVMRIKDINLELDQNSYSFDSPVVDKINIKRETAFIDVEIILKEKVNYRVYTNQNGLYIEFPEIKSTPLTPEVKPSVKPVLTQVKSTPGVKTLSGIKTMSKDDSSVEFQLVMNAQTNYEVIPIPDPPIRLAIDLHNTKAENIKKWVDHLNVKSVRGAKNKPGVYRVVFDLLYLKHYDVSLDGQSLKVKFSNEPIQVETQPEVLAKNEKPLQEPEESNILVANVEKETPLEIPEEKVEEKPVIANTQNEMTSKNKTEFFSSEKSQVPQNTDQQEFLNYDDEEEDTDESKLSYVKQTISSGSTEWTGEPISFSFYEMQLKNVLIFIAKFAGLSLVLDPDVSGTITCEMTDIPWDQALDYFLRINGLDQTLEGRLLRIAKVNKLAREAEERRKKREQLEMQGELEVAIRPLSYISTNQISSILSKQLSGRGQILADTRSNTLIISDLPNKLEIIDRLITQLDTPVPQVSIEARIVETSSNYTKNLGIQWGYNMVADSLYGNQTTLKFPNSIAINGSQLSSQSSPFIGPLGGYAVNVPGSGANSGMAFSLGNVSNTFRLDVALTAMENQGKGRIVSSPKATTQNNQAATIVQGKQIPVQTIQNNTVTVQYKNAALELRVLPQITAEGTIVTTISIQNNAADFANLVNGIPPITTQSVETTVMIDDGGTIVIGGLYRIENSHSSDSVPFFSKLPILGNLFKNSSRRTEQKETLVFITPRIIK